MDPLARLADRWRQDAERFRAYGDARGARTCELHAEELEAATQKRAEQGLTIEEAARESGYSESRLYALLSEGKVDNAGSRGDPRIRRCDLPRKAGLGPPAREREPGFLVARRRIGP